LHHITIAILLAYDRVPMFSLSHHTSFTVGHISICYLGLPAKQMQLVIHDDYRNNQYEAHGYIHRTIIKTLIGKLSIS
jgi:hypothetical protein